ncbi:acyl-CoA dehydrogenase [Roseinatronobacter alkalisoli]|uniref:Acyl-coenzyme A dehydrogenase n=1 Tax=Roseinatronobacter alkalisoli TaxID=3028235 RepID=A0ABT5TCB8_9RHOB|nr:acyl-CoA dehydrogenase [Roseinatronobacter sp. HJB301]MDD7972772.1 acyl-CoA dehydrogenase [Roseinatronobacter sp. HJB301]
MSSFRRERITKPIFRWAKGAMPGLSQTEREALEAGEVWWDADLMSGNPDWEKLLAVRAPQLSTEERDFLNGPCVALCQMLDDWTINQTDGDLSPVIWDYMRQHRFFGMIIPRAYGGLGFSAFAHSEVVRRLSMVSIPAAVTVMVPNSLGPGELLHLFGTDEQKDYWLPRLADGRELPAFGLTSNEAGSDASAMLDSGVVCRGDWKGQEVLGIRLNWSKRYITLAPVCTLLGLAFKLQDPDGLLGDDPEPGITCALVPTDLPGVQTGRRHIPSGTMFQNGPTVGKDVFIPVDNIIGGAPQAGKGWMMLMSALAAGRGVSLPSLACAGTTLAAHSSGAYARVREQFNLPIAKFGGIQEPLARLAADAYAVNAARHLTCAGLDEGRALSVISALMKYTATERMRAAINDAMDIHAGKAVIDGPSNYLSASYRAVPVGITVEGANIVTRSLMVFGQGAIRAHPHLLDEILALENGQQDAGLAAFDTHFWLHVRHSIRTMGRSIGRALTGARFAPAPRGATDARDAPLYRELARWSAAYAITADMAFLTIGGGLKRMEMLSGRMADILSELYVTSAVLKRWQDEGRQASDFDLVAYNAQRSFARISALLDETIANFPSRGAAFLLRVITLPRAVARPPSDALTARCAALISEPGPVRDRLTGDVTEPGHGAGIIALNDAFDKTIAADPLRRRLRELDMTPAQALEAGLLTQTEKDQLDDLEKAVAKVIAVDDFSPDEFAAMLPAPKIAGRTPKKPEAAE